MSWLDNFSMKWTAPYDAMALAKYREIHAMAPPSIQSPLNYIEEWYHFAMKHQDPRVKVSKKRKEEEASTSVSAQMRRYSNTAYVYALDFRFLLTCFLLRTGH